jgi:hypothetical protein
MPDQGKRGKDIAILQMGQDAYENFGNPELRYAGNDQAVLAHSGLVVARSQVPRSELIRTRYVASWPVADLRDERADVPFVGWSGPAPDGLARSPVDPERSSSAWRQRFRKPTLSLVIQPVSNVLV